MTSPSPIMLITGASRGIGAAIAEKSAQAGYHIALNYSSNKDKAEALQHSLSKLGGKVIIIQANVASEEEVRQMFEQTTARLGPIDVLVNNAGITGGFSRLDQLKLKTLQDTFAINVTGTFLCAREAVRLMSLNRDVPSNSPSNTSGKGGVIINMSSRAAHYGGGGEWVHYAASKGAIDTFTKGLATEVAREGIRVNAVAPGFIDTELHLSAGDGDRAVRLGKLTPMARAGHAKEVADCVLWLASSEASYITGAIIPVAGGR